MAAAASQLPAFLASTAERRITGAGTDHRRAREVIDELATEVLERPLDTHARMIRRATQFSANIVASSKASFVECFVLIHRSSSECLLAIADEANAYLVADLPALILTYSP